MADAETGKPTDTVMRPKPSAEPAPEPAAAPPTAADIPQPLPDLPPTPAGAISPSAPGAIDPAPAQPTTSPGPRPRGPRRARLRLTRIDPWSVMKTSFLLSIAFAVVTVVSVAMVWQVLGAAGVWDSINSTIQEGIGGEDIASFQVQDYVGTSRVLGFTMLVAAIDVVLITATATLSAFLYNMAAALLGGIELTLAEDSH